MLRLDLSPEAAAAAVFQARSVKTGHAPISVSYARQGLRSGRLRVTSMTDITRPPLLVPPLYPPISRTCATVGARATGFFYGETQVLIGEAPGDCEV